MLLCGIPVREGASGVSVKLYLAAVRHLQIAVGLGDPRMSEWPRLGYVVRGMKRTAAALKAKPRFPITPEILRKLRQE